MVGGFRTCLSFPYGKLHPTRPRRMSSGKLYRCNSQRMHARKSYFLFVRSWIRGLFHSLIFFLVFLVVFLVTTWLTISFFFFSPWRVWWNWCVLVIILDSKKEMYYLAWQLFIIKLSMRFFLFSSGEEKGWHKETKNKFYCLSKVHSK